MTEELHRVAIVGSREFNDALFMDKVVWRLVQRYGDRLVIVSGGARGADMLAELAARRLCKRPPERIEALWSLHGDRAGPIRNEQIAKVSDEMVAIYDPRSRTRGTAHAVKSMLKLGKQVYLYLVEVRTWVTDPDVLKKWVDSIIIPMPHEPSYESTQAARYAPSWKLRSAGQAARRRR